VLLKGRVIKGWGKATKFWQAFPPEYKRLFTDFYPGTLNVDVGEVFIAPPSRVMTLNYPPFLFKGIWAAAKWRSVDYLPVRVNGIGGFLVILNPSSVGRPKHILEFILEDYVGEEEVEIEL
jgi:CTP-dependent riboflavin kinase